MDYIQIAFSFTSIQEYQKDLLIAELADIGFDTFEDTATGFDAFMIANQFNETALNEVLMGFGDELQYTYLINEMNLKTGMKSGRKILAP